MKQLDEAQGHPVDVQHHVEPAPVLPVHHLGTYGIDVEVIGIPAAQ
jgi:hypothetical protein